ncbi:TPA: class I SAM-dependent methyltransferase [Salmonella enterica subsp. enterica serovar Ball]|nr:class I SAM-dependent methyltransferase [Salmonella enterica subsp. enterica serovar Ball]
MNITSSLIYSHTPIRSYQNYVSFINTLWEDNEKYINPSHINESLYSELVAMETGGFSHGGISENYGIEQLSQQQVLYRKWGYLALSHLLQRKKQWSENDILLDALAGNGTFERTISQLYSRYPACIGNDVSLPMVMQGIQDGRRIYWTDITRDILNEGFADYAIAAYGFHHVPINRRTAFIQGMISRMKLGGILTVHDFVSGTPTARWYSECIHQYRTVGHDYPHFTPDELYTLLINSGLKEISINIIYDPFIIPVNQDDDYQHIISKFVVYLIRLFSLDKLFYLCEEKTPDMALIAKLANYFHCSDNELQQITPLSGQENTLCNSISVRNINGQKYLIAPRTAIAAVGER